MASRRMFSRRITDSSRFVRMPLSAQALYFHLGQHADDDGVVEAYPVMRMIGANEDDLRMLILKEFVIPLNNDYVSYLPDWMEHNKIRADRKEDSLYIDLLLQVVPDAEIRQAKPSYYSSQKSICQTNGGQMPDKQQANDGIGKDRLGKDSIDKSINNICASVPDDTTKANRKKEANELFEQLWKAYPSKKGKAQVSDTAKAKLLKIGYDEMMRAIDRYTYDFEKDSDWRKLQNGSTFFNSGYVDYLDANYKSAEDAQKESDHEKAKELERRCWGDIKPIEGNDLPFKYEG